MSKLLKVIVIVLAVIVRGAIDFLITAGIVALAAMAFNFTFTWFKAFVIWLIITVLGLSYKASSD